MGRWSRHILVCEIFVCTPIGVIGLVEYVSANLVHIDRLVLCELVIIFYIGSQSRARLAWPAVGSAPDCEPGARARRP